MGLTRKEIKQDRFGDLLHRIGEWIVDHTREIGFGFLAVVVLAGALYGWSAYRSSQNLSAQRDFAEAFRIYQAPIRAADSETPAIGGLTYPSEEERDRAALEKFIEVSDQRSGHAVGSWALKFAAQLHDKLGDKEKADATWLDLSSRSAIPELKVIALRRLGNRAMEAERHEEAIDYFSQALSAPESSAPIQEILFDLGKSYEAAGNTDSALEQYRRLEAEFPGDALTQQASERIQALAPEEEESEG